jgi:hypothetical protein
MTPYGGGSRAWMMRLLVEQAMSLSGGVERTERYVPEIPKEKPLEQRIAKRHEDAKIESAQSLRYLDKAAEKRARKALKLSQRGGL